jgi:hypothetical protein
MTDRLHPGESLTVDGSITSPNGRSTLILQGDGNLVLYRSDGVPHWASGTYGQEVGQALMQDDGNFVMYGPGGAIWASHTHGNPGAWLIIQDDGNVVIYGPDGNPLWATDTAIARRMVPGFLPSTSGLHFTNRFPQVPLVTIDVLGIQVQIGDASNGLCGGMAFTARDYFEAGSAPPSNTEAPSQGPLFDYLVQRLFDSFNLPGGPVRYMYLMNPTLPDHETVMSTVGLAPHGRAWVMINEEWPKIQADLDSGYPSPMGLVSIKSADPFQMGQNHQVLAYGYELDGTDLAICVYDPNYPNHDNRVIQLSLADPAHSTAVRYSGALGGDGQIWCFFRPDYAFSAPPV